MSPENNSPKWKIRAHKVLLWVVLPQVPTLIAGQLFFPAALGNGGDAPHYLHKAEPAAPPHAQRHARHEPHKKHIAARPAGEDTSHAVKLTTESKVKAAQPRRS